MGLNITIISTESDQTNVTITDAKSAAVNSLPPPPPMPADPTQAIPPPEGGGYGFHPLYGWAWFVGGHHGTPA